MFDSHTAHMCEIFMRISKSGFKLNLARSQICCKKIRFLGLNINADGIEAIDGHIKAVQNLKRQINAKIAHISWLNVMDEEIHS